jgi:threonine/homoserine/homoserine lactone efflux protein
MSLQLYLSYVAACVAIVLVPGATVTVIIANGMNHGARAGLLNIAGTQLGLALMTGVVMAGLATIIETMGVWFDWVRLAGAAYLIWLGWKLVRSRGVVSEAGAAPKPRAGFFWQGFLVLLSNPKALLLFGAFIPQFVDPKGDYVWQVALLGATFMAIALIFDGAYAVLAGRAGRILTQRRVRLVSRLSGAILIGGGLWLALARRS